MLAQGRRRTWPLDAWSGSPVVPARLLLLCLILVGLQLTGEADGHVGAARVLHRRGRMGSRGRVCGLGWWLAIADPRDPSAGR